MSAPRRCKGLLGNVDIWRDAWGIPHVRGAPYQDAFAGLGFAQAQDRLWQMEALLRRGTGRYAEWLGARAVAGDVIARQMNGAAASRRDFALLGDEAKAMLEAYARGVNAFIALAPMAGRIQDPRLRARAPGSPGIRSRSCGRSGS